MRDNEILKIINDMKMKQTDLRRRYGDIRPIIHIELSGYHFVAIGDKIIYSNKWRTFIDFLIEYLWHLFGNEWLEEEKKKQENDRHVILNWWDSIIKFQKTQKKNENGLYFSRQSGPFKAFINLAYDLYLLAHHMILQNSIVKRLKNKHQFQGVRYELFVASTFIRTGFEIMHENETDRSKKHVEFIAKHKKSGELIAIEAKSKHRPGVLGFSGEMETTEEIRVRVSGLINSAIVKKPEYPYMIFIDLNLPPGKMTLFIDDPTLRELIKTLDSAFQTDEGKDIFNIILYTNFPYHYGHELNEPPDDHLSSVISCKPIHPFVNESIINDIQVAVKTYGRIPNSFSEFERRIV